MSKSSSSYQPQRLRTHRRGGQASVFAVIAAFWLAFLSCANAASFTVSFDRDTISLGEYAILTLTFQGGAPSGSPVLPDIPNLNVSSPPGEASRFNYVNGVSSTSVAYTYTVTPVQPGAYVIPALSISIGGQRLTSLPAKLTVLKPGENTPVAPNQGDPSAFTRLVVPKQKVYVGEVIHAQFELLVRGDVAGMQNPQMSQVEAEGFTMGKSQEEPHTQTRIGGAVYAVVPMSLVFTAAKVGTLKLGPVTCSMDLLFGPVDFFGRPTRVQHLTITNEVVAIESLPLPKENQPPGFKGAVGTYSLSVSANPTNVAVGDPITVTIQISGRGAVDSIALPEQTGWQQFKLYPPTSDFQPADQLNLSGSKTFKLTAVPESMDAKELPPFIFSFFDPDQKAYRSLTQAAIPLVVRPSAASLPPPALSTANATGDSSSTNQDIAGIKLRPGSLAQIRPPLVTQPWFLTLQSVPVMAWLSLLVARRQKEKLAANPRLRRQRRVEQTIHHGLKELRQQAAANHPELFFATLFHLLQERLGERLDLPASAITEAILDERLRPLNVPEETLDQLRQLFHACNQARYARQNSNEELVSLIPAAESALQELKTPQT